jgi:hypothetical protein
MLKLTITFYPDFMSGNEDPGITTSYFVRGEPRTNINDYLTFREDCGIDTFRDHYYKSSEIKSYVLEPLA